MSDTDVFQINTEINEDELEKARAYLNLPLRIQQYNYEASRDAIRHYAYGVGDDNPLWCDPDYAATSPYGGIVAPPTFFYTFFSAGITPAFDGLQAFFGGGRFKVHRLVRRDEEVVPTAKLVDMYEASGKTASKMVIQVGSVEYRTKDGELLCEYESRAIRTPRRADAGGPTHKPRDPYAYTEAEYAAIEAEVLAQTRRGAEKRYWDDVVVGDILPARVKGPMNMATYMSYYAGNLNGAGYVACEMQWRTRYNAQHHPELVPNNRGLGWLIEQTWPGVAHTDDRTARQVGMPGAYDNGWNRLGWLSQTVTDWCGDHGHLDTIDVRVRAPNLMGDTTWCSGTVIGKRQEGGKNIVDVELIGKNQLGTVNTTGTASVLLPSKND
ncbi:hypothetical protein DM806_17415 [Sphingobium lactosutens]|uniref:FAS1-like dehydratase domain-containing protein n=1 Tax=Sphingobium lactosutens TaxID=522773 RepID=UPI0015BBAA1D|nr:hypothetical protein [Sphingobium lactosutens]